MCSFRKEWIRVHPKHQVPAPRDDIMLVFIYRAEGAPLVETLWSRGLFQEQPPQSWWKPQVAFLILLGDEVIFRLGQGKISSSNTSISPAFSGRMCAVMQLFFFFLQLRVAGWHRRVWPHRFSVKNERSGARMLFLRVCLRRWFITSNDLPMIA